jgi:hypothetical protein
MAAAAPLGTIGPIEPLPGQFGQELVQTQALPGGKVSIVNTQRKRGKAKKTR